MVLAADGTDLYTVALRPHLIWGPGDHHIVPRLIQRARAGRLVRIKGGPYLVDSVYIDNAADAHILAADRLGPDAPCRGKAYFICNGEPQDVFDLVDRIIGAAGLRPIRKSVSPFTAYLAGGLMEIIYRLFRLPGEPPMTRFVAKQMTTAHWFDRTASYRDLGYSPRVTIAEGLKRLKQHLAEHPV
jgi:nucleoside-diphosphate-sugar epimerase